MCALSERERFGGTMRTVWAANRGEEKATGLGASNDGSWRSYPAHSLEDRGVEEIFVGGEGEPEFIGVRLGPFRAWQRLDP